MLDKNLTHWFARPRVARYREVGGQSSLDEMRTRRSFSTTPPVIFSVIIEHDKPQAGWLAHSVSQMPLGIAHGRNVAAGALLIGNQNVLTQLLEIPWTGIKTFFSRCKESDRPPPLWEGRHGPRLNGTKIVGWVRFSPTRACVGVGPLTPPFCGSKMVPYSFTMIGIGHCRGSLETACRPIECFLVRKSQPNVQR